MQAATYQNQYELTADHPHFDGHFPGFPVFPAVSQIELAVRLFEKESGQPVKLIRVKRAKFRAILRPGTTVTLEVTVSPNDLTEMRWLLRDTTQIYSQGELEVSSSVSPRIALAPTE